MSGQGTGFSFNFSGRLVFVAGGTSGINLGVAEAFSKSGASVAVASRDPQKVEHAVALLSAPGRPAHGFAFDVRDAAAVSKALEQLAEQAGPLDVVVSGAAGNFPAAAATLSPNGFKAVVDIDLLGTFNVLRAAHARLRRPGAIVNVSAPQAAIPMALQSHVCAAKAGVEMLTKTLALEWGPEGIRVNAVVPGPIAGTEGVSRLAPGAEAERALAESVPLRRLGSAAEVADACLFLASDAARYVSGTVLHVDGGWTAAGARLPA